MILKTFKSDIEIIRERDPAARGIMGDISLLPWLSINSYT